MNKGEKEKANNGDEIIPEANSAYF